MAIYVWAEPTSKHVPLQGLEQLAVCKYAN